MLGSSCISPVLPKETMGNWSGHKLSVHQQTLGPLGVRWLMETHKGSIAEDRFWITLIGRLFILSSEI